MAKQKKPLTSLKNTQNKFNKAQRTAKRMGLYLMLSGPPMFPMWVVRSARSGKSLLVYMPRKKQYKVDEEYYACESYVQALEVAVECHRLQQEADRWCRENKAEERAARQSQALRDADEHIRSINRCL
jgi:hypothetical protein